MDTDNSENSNINIDNTPEQNDLEINSDKNNNQEESSMGNCTGSETSIPNDNIPTDNMLDENISDNESDVIDESIFIEQMKKGKQGNIKSNFYENSKSDNNNSIKSNNVSKNSGEKRGFFSTLYKKHEKDNIQQQINSLDIMIEALYDAVSKAQRNIRMNNINELDYYFPYNEEEDVREPKTMSIKLPSKTDNGFDIIEVPIYSLVNHTPLDINEFNIKFKANMCSAKKVKDNYDSNPYVRHKKYMISTDVTGNGKNVAEIELKCKITDPPEGLSRLSEVLEKVI